MITIPPNTEKMADVANRWNSGQTQTKIAKDLGLSKQRVQQILKRCPNYHIHVKSREDLMAERTQRNT